VLEQIAKETRDALTDLRTASRFLEEVGILRA
jgi:hypothetical protein